MVSSKVTGRESRCTEELDEGLVVISGIASKEPNLSLTAVDLNS